MESRIAGITADLKSALSDIRKAFGGLVTQTVPLSELFTQVKRPEKIDAEKSYRLLGVKWWGLGTFVREEKTGRQIKGTKLYQVAAGDVIYNRLFAFRGSFAVVPADHDGCHVSGEFPTFTIQDDVREPQLVAAYVVHCLNSPQYLDEVDRISTGSAKTSRNRYKEKRFLQMRVAIPRTVAQMRAVVALLDRARELKRQEEAALDELSELTKGITRMLPLWGPTSGASAATEILSRRAADPKPPAPKKSASKKRRA